MIAGIWGKRGCIVKTISRQICHVEPVETHKMYLTKSFDKLRMTIYIYDTPS